MCLERYAFLKDGIVEMRIDDRVLDEIRQKSSIVDVISEYVDLKKKGSNYMGLCPFHSEKTPSFSVSESKQIFKCFGCSAGGDVITFIMKIEHLSFIEAVKFLAEKYNIELSEEKVDKKKLDKITRCYDANVLAAKFYMQNLKKNKMALEYLERREIGPEVITAYGLGFAEDSWNNLLNYMKSNGYNEEELVEYNLVSKSQNGKYFDRFRNRIMFPIIDLRRRVIAFGGRVMDDSMPKYLNSTDTVVFHKGRNLYNQNIVKNLDRSRIILVEGYMDVISLYKSGIKYSVASLGTALTPEQAELVKKFGKDVYICYDGDEAGIRATKRAIGILRSVGVNPKIIRLPEGLDPDEYLKKYGAFNFEVTLSEATNYFEYLIEDLKKNFDISTTEGMTGFLVESAKLVATIKNPIERDLEIDRLSKDYKVTRSAIINYINRNKQNYEDKRERNREYNLKNSRQTTKPVAKNIQNGFKKSKYLLMAYAAADENYIKIIKKYLNLEEYLEKNEVEVIKSLEEAYEKSAKDPLENLKENGKITETSYRIIKEIEVSHEYPDRIIEELAKTIIKSKLQEDLKSTLSKLEKLDRNEPNYKEKLKELSEIIIDLNQKLKGGMKND